jgi:O-antigen/teichoic acid export membrane protein
MTPGIRQRFAFTVGSNLLRSLLSFATGMLLARWLGPASYGDLAFLLGTFLAVKQLLDMGSTTAFFTFMSQETRSRAFVRAFIRWLSVTYLVPLVITGLLMPVQWIHYIWRGQPRGLVLLGFTASFLQDTVWPVMQQAAESRRQTVKVQSLSVAVMALHLATVVLLWLTGVLGLYSIFALMAAEYLLAAFLAHRRAVAPFLRADEPRTTVRQPILRGYIRYCLPLVPYAWVSFAYTFADRWLLQNYGGSVQQAYYSVGAQFSSVALIATASILQIFWKEIAEAHHAGNYVRTGVLYRKVSRLLFLIGAIIAGFLYSWAEDVLHLLLGASYVSGALTLAIMFFYPVHQSMGQIGSTMLYATERVPLYVRLGIGAMLVSIAVAYLVLASPGATVPGLGLGSAGLALKMVVVQLVQVNIVAYVIARTWKWPFDWSYQAVALLGCAALGWSAHAITTTLVGGTVFVPAQMAVAGLVYLALIAGFVYALPWLTGFTRAELRGDLMAMMRAAFG